MADSPANSATGNGRAFSFLTGDHMTQEFDLTVQVPASEWAYAQRRARWLATLLLRVVRDRAELCEWYGAADLEALRLPGLPPSRQGIARKAAKEGWRRKPRGQSLTYHVSSLPPRAFDALLSRIIDLPEIDTDTDGLFDLPAMPPPPDLPENTAPQWVLPLMRLMKGEARGDLGRAWRELPEHLPDGVILPDVREAAKVLASLRLF